MSARRLVASLRRAELDAKQGIMPAANWFSLMQRDYGELLAAVTAYRASAASE
jgi:hypothetical protein